MERNRKNRLSWVTAAWALLTVALAYLPRWSFMNDRFSGLGLNHGPIAHFIAYSVLVFLIAQLLRNCLVGALQISIAAWLLTGTFASLVELGQHFLPHRTFDVQDIWLNLTAAAAGAVIWLIFNRLAAPRS